jgi:hypothetical protein
MCDNYENIGDVLLVSKFCMLTMPCKHRIIDISTGKHDIMSGDKIYRLLRKHNIKHSHFDYYEEYVRQRDFPTPEEIAKREQEKKKWNGNEKQMK